jgi:hypothetical protein
MHTHRLPRYERHRRLQTIGLTIAIGLMTAALAAAAIYFLYSTAHLRR